MRRIFALLAFLPTLLSAQSAEVVTRVSSGKRTDMAARVSIPHLFVELGDVSVKVNCIGGCVECHLDALPNSGTGAIYNRS